MEKIRVFEQKEIIINNNIVNISEAVIIISVGFIFACYAFVLISI